MILKPPKGAMVNRGHNLSRGLVGLWLMNEGGGNIVNDISGNGNTGSLVADTHFVAGKFGSGIDFDGDGGTIQVPYSSELSPSTGLSIVMWAYIREWKTDGSLLIKNGSCLFEVNNSTEFRLYCYGLTTPSITKAIASYSLDRWYQIIGTYNGNRLALFVDGIEVAGVSSSGSISENTNDLYINRIWPCCYSRGDFF